MTITYISTETSGPGAVVPVGARRHRSTGAPNYALRQAVAASAAVAVGVVAVMVLAAMLAGFGGAPAVASGAPPAPSTVAAHVARPGDTLWSIARDHRGEVDHRRYVEALIDLNGGSSIEAGQAIRLP